MSKSYEDLKAELKKTLAGVEQFSIKFSCPPTVSTLSHVRTGSTRVFKRKSGSNYFIMANTKILVTATTVAQILFNGQGALILPEPK